MEWSYSELKRKLMQAGLWPEGRMSRLACYLAALAVGLYALENLLRLFKPSWGEHLGGWVTFLGFLAGVLFFILAFRWIKRRILWRLRNRLIVTYVFIGLIPAVLLIAMGLITLYGLGGQFAVFVVTSEIHAQLRSRKPSIPPLAMNLRRTWNMARSQRPNLWWDCGSGMRYGTGGRFAPGMAGSRCRFAKISTALRSRCRHL